MEKVFEIDGAKIHADFSCSPTTKEICGKWMFLKTRQQCDSCYLQKVTLNKHEFEILLQKASAYDR